MAWLSMSCAVGASAAVLSPDAALQRAMGASPAKLAGQAPSRFKLAKTFEAAGQPSVYVFNLTDGSGFTLAAADDIAPALLGYSEGANFDMENAAPEFLWMMEEYGRQMEWLRVNGMKYAQEAPYREPVEALVKTQWNQDYPYNLDCPKEGTRRTYVGCVATATAQVVNYHQWPAENGIGEYSYEWNGKTHSFNYGENSFDWDNMALKYPYNVADYPSNDMDVINEAVAKLSFACGVGVNMMYGTQASGAHSFRIPRLLVENLGYDPSARYVMRDCYGFTEWNDMMYAEVAAGRPVLYAGAGDGGGHEFICDGYSEQNLFHINWGWGGMCDGFFLLSMLDPYQQGIGGSTTGDGFDRSQDAVISIMPPQEGVDNPTGVSLISYGGFSPTYSEEDDYYYFVFGDGQAAAYLFSGVTFRGYVSLKVVSENGDVAYCDPIDVLEISGVTSEGYLNGIRGFVCDYESLSLPEGRYQAYPVVRWENESVWQSIPTPAGSSRYCWLDVDAEGKISFEAAEPEMSGNLMAQNINVKKDRKTGDLSFVIEFINDGEVTYDDTVALLVTSEDGSEVLSSTKFRATVKTQIAEKVTVDWNPYLEEGNYAARIETLDGKDVSGLLAISIPETKYPKIEILNVEAPELKMRRQSVVKVELVNSGEKDFSESLIYTLLDSEGVKVQESASTAMVSAGQQQTRNVKFTPVVPEGTYQFGVYNNNGQLLGALYDVTVIDPSGVEEIIAEDSNFELYTPQGVLIGKNLTADEMLRLPKGVYIKRTAAGAAKIML